MAKRVLLVALALLLVGAAALVSQRARLVERAFSTALRARGFPEARMSVTRLDLDGAELRNVSAGPGLALERIVLRWSSAGLRQGRVDEIEAEGLALAVALDEAGVSFPGLPPPSAPPRGEAGEDPGRALLPAALPIGRASIEDVEVAVETPWGPARLTGRAELGAARGRFEGRLAPAVLALGAAGEVNLPALDVAAVAELDAGGIDFEASAADPPGCLSLRAEGRHDLASGAGQAAVTLERARLGPGALEATQIVPAARALLQSARGSVEGSGTLRWGDDEARSHVDLAARGIDLVTTLARFEQIATELRIEGPPWPPPVRRGQLVSMELFDFGLALTDGEISYGILPDGTIEITRAEWAFAGGRVRTAGALDLGAEEQALLLVIEDVDLARLLELVNLTGLQGAGRVSGRLPLFRRSGELEIRGGELATDDQGWIRYAAGPEVEAVESTQSGLGEALRALRDFRYESLAVTLDGNPQGVVEIGLSLKGRNPTYFAGHRVDFNLNLEAPLFTTLRSTRLGTELPDAITRRLVPGAEAPAAPPVDCRSPAG